MTDFDPAGSPITLTPIAHIQSCYPERFGIPRQAGLVPSAQAEILLDITEANKLALRGIEGFSHIWVIFLFHKHHYATVKPLVQPPRLGGRKTMGVYATRSPNRPNPIGMSAVKLEGVEQKKGKLRLQICGGDFLDGTPVLDIKPYIPYADAIASADSTWVTPHEASLTVEWSEGAIATLEHHFHTIESDIKPIQQLISETIAQDPRPAHEQGKDGRKGQEWNMQVREFSVFWSVAADVALITRLEPHQPIDSP